MGIMKTFELLMLLSLLTLTLIAMLYVSPYTCEALLRNYPNNNYNILKSFLLVSFALLAFPFVLLLFLMLGLIANQFIMNERTGLFYMTEKQNHMI